MSAAVRESTNTVGKWMTWATPEFGDYDALCWFAKCNEARATGIGHEFGVFTASGQFVGGCGLNQVSNQNKLCNLGYWVRESMQQRGAATAATLALQQLAFSSLALCRVRADPNLSHRADPILSQGFEPVAGCG